MRKRIKPVEIIIEGMEVFEDTKFVSIENQEEIEDIAKERMRRLHGLVDSWRKPTFDVDKLHSGYFQFARFKQRLTGHCLKS